MGAGTLEDFNELDSFEPKLFAICSSSDQLLRLGPQEWKRPQDRSNTVSRTFRVARSFRCCGSSCPAHPRPDKVQRLVSTVSAMATGKSRSTLVDATRPLNDRGNRFSICPRRPRSLIHFLTTTGEECPQSSWSWRS